MTGSIKRHPLAGLIPLKTIPPNQPLATTIRIMAKRNASSHRKQARQMWKVCQRLEQERMQPGDQIPPNKRIAAHYLLRFHQEIKDILLISLFDDDQRFITDCIIYRGKICWYDIPEHKITGPAREFSASGILLVQYRPKGSLEVKVADLGLTDTLQEYKIKQRFTLLDGLIVGPKGHFSLKLHDLIDY